MVRQLTLPDFLSGTDLGLSVRFSRCILVIFCLMLWCTGCGKERESSEKNPGTVVTPVVVVPALATTAESPFRFSEGAAQTGVKHSYSNDAEHGFFTILESLGGGIGMLDFDRDGLQDLFAPGGGRFDSSKQPTGRASSLFRQYFAAVGVKGSFADVAAAAGVVESPHFSHGGIVSDYDNDGFDDILLTGYGGLQLFHNLGDGTFQQVASEVGLTDSLWSSSAAWADFNGDGANDIYVAHYVDWSPEHDPQCFLGDDVTREVCPPRSFTGLPDAVYLSDGSGRFLDASHLLSEVPPSKGLGVAAADIDLDGDIDVYVTNDTKMNFLLINEAGKGFTETGASSATGYGDTGREDGSMGVDIGDYNGDGLPDIWVTNYENETFALYRSFDGRVFQHVSRSTGISAAGGLSVGWGTVFGDLDLDGDEDLFAANGHVIRHPVNSPLNQRALLLLNEDQKRFREVAASAGPYLASQHMSRGVAQGDLDDDGDLDLVVSNINQPLAILRNESTRLGNWIELELIGVQSPRWAEGAWVEFVLDNDRRILRLRKGGTSYASTSDRRIHAGLGTCDRIAKINIHWPSGIVQYLDNITTNQQLQVVESDNATARVFSTGL